MFLFTFPRMEPDVQRQLDILQLKNDHERKILLKHKTLVWCILLSKIQLEMFNLEHRIRQPNGLAMQQAINRFAKHLYNNRVLEWDDIYQLESSSLPSVPLWQGLFA